MAREPKERPAYAITSVDHALRIATMLQLEGELSVSQAADRLGVARSTAHRLLRMLVYRDFAVATETRTYRPGPVLELAAHSRSTPRSCEPRRSRTCTISSTSSASPRTS